MLLLAHAFSTSGPWAWVVYVGIGLCTLGAARLAGYYKRVPERVAGILIVVGIALAAVAGTVHPEEPDPSTRPVSSGKVTIAAPAAGSVIDPAQVTVEVEVADFELVALGAVGQPRPGYGHLHVTVDGQVQPQMEGTAFPVCVPSGPHTIAAFVVAEDHFGFMNEGELTDTVQVEGAPGNRC